MTDLAILLGGALVVGVVWLLVRNATLLFTVRVTEGRCRLIRGRAPHALLRDLEDVTRRARLDGVTLSFRTSDRRPTLDVRGTVPEAVVQQLRNVLGRFPLQRIRSGSRRA